MKKTAWILSGLILVGCGASGGGTPSGRYKTILAIPTSALDAVAEFGPGDSMSVEIRAKGASGKVPGKFKIANGKLSWTTDLSKAEIKGVPKEAMASFKNLLKLSTGNIAGDISWRGKEFTVKTKTGLSTFTPMGKDEL